MDFDVRLSNTINYTPMNLDPIGTQAFRVLQWLPIQKLNLFSMCLFKFKASAESSYKSNV